MNYETTIATHNARIARMVESSLWDKANTLYQSDARKQIQPQNGPYLQDQRKVEPDELRQFVGNRANRIIDGSDSLPVRD